MLRDWGRADHLIYPVSRWHKRMLHAKREIIVGENVGPAKNKGRMRVKMMVKRGESEGKARGKRGKNKKTREGVGGREGTKIVVGTHPQSDGPRCAPLEIRANDALGTE